MRNIEKACAVTGHRVLLKDFNEENLKNIFVNIVNSGVDNFLIGMALGFDTVCFKILHSLKENYKIKITAVVPCENQDKSFNLKQKKEYKNMLDIADEVIVLNKEYITGCMQQRNRYLVENSSILVAYMYKNLGGTVYTVNYARKLDKKIIFV